ncbi:MAG: mismatch repair protein MutS, partial [Bacteroidota bacterium]
MALHPAGIPDWSFPWPGFSPGGCSLWIIPPFHGGLFQSEIRVFSERVTTVIPLKEKEDKAAKDTPLMRQYNAIKAQHPGTVLLFRVGDFYETFGEDAVKVSEILGIVLTRRNNGAGVMELAGFPHHSLDTYLPRLVRAGQRVAVCDQLEDPKQAIGIVKRGVTELVTPGVAISDKMLHSKESNYLAALHFRPKEVGLAFVEVSTGEFFCLSGSVQQADKLMNTLKPSEVLVPRKDLRQFKEEIGEKFYISRLEDWIFQPDYAMETLRGHFKTRSLKGFGVDQEEAGVVAAGAILHYLRENQQTQIDHISGITRFDDSGFVWLDQFTIRNLELLHPNHPDGKSLVDVLDLTVTPMGARLLRRWLLFPLKDLGLIRKRLETVEALLKDQDNLRRMEDILKKTGDLERHVSKLATRKTQPREAMMLRNSLRLLTPLRRVLRDFGVVHMDRREDAFQDISEALGLLEGYLQEDPNNNLNTGGVIRPGWNAELDELRNISANGKDLLLDMQQREIDRTGISSLKIGYNKVFGYYLEVTNSHKDKAPDDWTRKQTLTGAERYITQELKEYEDKILHAEERIVALETMLYADLLEKLQVWLFAIQHNALQIAELDIFACFANAALRRSYCKPE